jgi:anaerobic magnesium-protoporphyrin IX monomethyl ester cyclase
MLDLLIISPSSAGLYQDLKKDFSAKETNIWAGLLANAVRDKHGVAIYDLEIERPDANKFYQTVKDYAPRLVLFVVTGQNPNASTAAMAGATEASCLLGSDFKIAFVGPHVNALPIETLEKHPEIDIVFTNEGVYALKNILQTSLTDNDLSGIKGIAYRDSDSNIKLNEPEKIVPQELLEQDLPGIAYDLMPSLNNYRTSTWHTNFSSETSPFASIYTSLGCFSKCSFCMINIINRTSNDFGLASDSFNIFRYWSPEFTIKQLEYLSDKGVKHLKIADEMFVYRPKHFLTLCELIIERGLDFNIWAYSRVDTAKPHYLETLRKAGVRHLALGIESANQTVRQEIDKGRFKEINIRDVVNEITQNDIGVGGNFIVGLPSDNYNTMQQTMNLALELDLANMNIYCSTALPGSPLYLNAKKSGRILPTKYSEFGFLSYDHIPDSTDELSSREVLEFRDYFFHSYFTNPSVLYRMKSKYGQLAVDNIKKMTSIKLQRKLLESQGII